MKNLVLLFMVMVSTTLKCTRCLDLSEVVFVIMSQDHPRHEAIAAETEEKLKTKLMEKFVFDPEIYQRHRDLPGENKLDHFNRIKMCCAPKIS